LGLGFIALQLKSTQPKSNISKKFPGYSSVALYQYFIDYRKINESQIEDCIGKTSSRPTFIGSKHGQFNLVFFTWAQLTKKKVKVLLRDLIHRWAIETKTGLVF